MTARRDAAVVGYVRAGQVEEVSVAAVARAADVDTATARAVLRALVDLEREAAPWKDPETLHRLYYEEGLTQAEIGERLGCAQRTIARWMDKHGIAPGRNRSKLAVSVPAELPASGRQ